LASERVERRLAAILAADVAGYSRLMGADEEGTLARLKACRGELIDPKIAEHRGRIVKTTGDGMLAEFASSDDAVRCAVEVQRNMAPRDTDLPADKRIAFRVGIMACTDGVARGPGTRPPRRRSSPRRPPRVTSRRLAVIMAADILGFSAMIERDEEATLTRVKALRRDRVAGARRA
jgi:class 3 adenylate cyclase